MLFNLEDADGLSFDERVRHDKTVAAEVINNICNIDTSHLKVVRGGKRLTGKCRPSKVILSQASDAVSVLKNRKKNTGRICISADYTPSQQRCYKQVSETLKRHRAEGVQGEFLKYIYQLST